MRRGRGGGPRRAEQLRQERLEKLLAALGSKLVDARGNAVVEEADGHVRGFYQVLEAELGELHDAAPELLRVEEHLDGVVSQEALGGRVDGVPSRGQRPVACHAAGGALRGGAAGVGHA
jgi:hypothetical protein